MEIQHKTRREGQTQLLGFSPSVLLTSNHVFNLYSQVSISDSVYTIFIIYTAVNTEYIMIFLNVKSINIFSKISVLSIIIINSE